MPFPLTEEQRAVVENRGGGLLVSAAAGSGKTRVLVERLLTRVEEEGLDIDRFLVITYTKAAAAELRGRVADELADRIALNPSSRRLRRQATLVYKTQISTIHSFCSALLRESGHLLDLDPDFRLCDEGEAGILMLRAMDAVLEDRYANITPESDFAMLVDAMSAGRDDRRLVQIALDMYGRVQSHPNPSAWLQSQLAAFSLEGIADAADTPWGALLLADARRQGEYWKGRIAAALDLCATDDKLSKGYAPSLSATLDALFAFCDGTKEGWDRAAALSDIPFPRLGGVRNCENAAAQERVKAVREACKKRMIKVNNLLGGSSDRLLEDLRLVCPAVRGLFALVEDFSSAYAKEKSRRGLLDFSDLEHCAVRLLVDENGPTELAEQWGARFSEVMVDEYQDTNEVQNAIFTAVSGGGRRLFMVGDVKQSIYRFRLADPTIFLKKYRTFKPWTEAEEGESRTIVLSRNFRSRPQVLQGANFLFRNLMSMEFGEMDYTPDQALYPGAAFPGEEENYRVELNALDLDFSQEEGEKAGRDLLEARFVSRRIRQLLDEGFPISDGSGGLRPARAEDMVILLRSPNSVLTHYARALDEQSLRWEADAGGDFFESTEVSVALSLLQVVDNPRQDVALISVLRSPVFGFTADRLAELRAGSPDTDFYGALAQGAENGGEDCAEFLAGLDALRDRAGDMSCLQLLWLLYDQTNLLGVFGAMEEGELRRENLLALCECARQFEDSGHKGLFGFLTHLTRLREGGQPSSFRSGTGEGGGVRLMSIHRSKGLEFPIVFLAGLARRLNREDMQKPMLFHPVLGVGPKGLDTGRMVEYTTLARLAVARQLESEMMAEELRLLYVAATRAREKLILTCALTGGARDLQKLAPDAGCPAQPQALHGAQSVAHWILLPVLARPDAEVLRDAAGTLVETARCNCGPEWDIRWMKGEGLKRAPRPEGREEEANAEQEDGQDLKTLLRWRYPWEGDVEIPSKLTATQLKGRREDEEAAEQTPQPPKPLQFGAPRFAEEAFGLTAAQKGTALHLVMQFIDFDKAVTMEGAAAEIERLVDRNIITAQQGAAAAPEKITRFFQSRLGRELMSSASLRRECKFSILVPAKDYYTEAGAGEEVLLQGVVDCWFETLEGITVVDFKTDRVTPKNAHARGEDYRPQLTAYSRALEEVTGKKVIRRALWFFSADTAVDL